jgi:hypothetical protein
MKTKSTSKPNREIKYCWKLGDRRNYINHFTIKAMRMLNSAG